MPNSHSTQNPTSYNWLSRQFHWLVAAMIIAMFALGWTMEPLALSKEKLNFYAWHKWLGIIILTIVLLRLGWRFVSKAPKDHNPNIPPLIHLMAKLGHIALYLLLLIIPILGWLRSSTAGYQVVLFEKIPLPDLMQKDPELSKLFAELHEITALCLLALLVGHIAAVVMHHIWFKDPVLLKMKPAIIHKLLLVGTLIVGGAFYANYILLNPPAKAPGKTASKEDISKEAATKVTETKTAKTTAQQWSIVTDKSTLEFSAIQKGAATTGNFKKFNLNKLIFDPSTPETAEVEIEIDVTSLSVGNLMVEQTLVTSSWFDASDFPQATFKAKNFKPAGENKYTLTGDLTIKDITKPLTLPLTITLSKDNDSGTTTISAKGEAAISRLQYEIGQGEWASTESIDEEVILKIHITAIKQG